MSDAGIAPLPADRASWGVERGAADDAQMQRLGDLARRMVNIQEAERRHLSGELHDQVGANLATVSLNLRCIGKMMPNPDPQRLDGILRETGALLAAAISSIRNACADLRPAVLDYSGLAPALKDLAQRVGRRGDMRVSFRQRNMQQRLPAQTEAMLFRIAQEALTNCAKHSHASRVDMAVCRRERSIVLTVADNGAGFDPELPGSPGLGLLTMRERAAMIGGRLSIISSPGNPTEVRVVVPVQTAAAAAPQVPRARLRRSRSALPHS